MAVRSPLTNYIDTSPHYDTGRGGNEIVYIAVHHAAMNNGSVAAIGKVFHSCQTSAHYGVDDTDIGNYVSESDTAWHIGNYRINQKSIGIEMSNCSGSPEWRVSDITVATTIKLVADIAYRLGWTYISYTGDMNGDLILHRWVTATACPGPYVVNKAIDRYIAAEADKLLKARRAGKTITVAPQGVKDGKLVIDGKFGFQSCLKLQKWLKVPFTPDGLLDGQLTSQREYILNMEYCVNYGKGGSQTVKLLQKKVGTKADGYLGPDTIKALQRYLNKQGYHLDVDGYAGPATCTALQNYLNKVA